LFFVFNVFANGSLVSKEPFSFPCFCFSQLFLFPAFAFSHPFRRVSRHRFLCKQGKAMLCKADQGEPLMSMEGSRVDRISEFSG